MNALDPDFELPSEWKFSMGITGELENNIRIDADVFFSKGEDTAVVRRGDLESKPVLLPRVTHNSIAFGNRRLFSRIVTKALVARIFCFLESGLRQWHQLVNGLCL